MAAVFQLFFPCLVFVLGRQNGVSGEVPDDVVYTDLHKTVRLGESVVLKCQFRGRPLAVYWKKGDDPRTAPNLVSWIPGDPVTGLCEGERPCQIMEMNEDFSLIIREVTIAEQGRYICRVSSYKGILIHNFTDISVFSTPRKPYSLINECLGSPDKNQNCIISTADPINISCSASGYYPDLDLFFLHGSQDVATIDSKESTNEDGTKNKSIVARTPPSPEPYVCVASDIPGVAGRSLASVLVNSPSFQVTTGITVTETASNPNKADHKLIVAVILSMCGCILLASVLIFCIWIKRKRNYDRLESVERNDEDPVSYLEIWKLVEMCDIAVGARIGSKLEGNPDRKSKYDFERTKADLYRELCEWKERRPRDVSTLYEAMEEIGLHNELRLMRDFRTRPAQISYDNLEHICWHVSRCRETVKPIVQSLYSHGEKMTKLTEDPQTPDTPRCAVIRDDFQLLKGWKTVSMTTHPDEDGDKDVTVKFHAGFQEVNIKDKTVKTIQPMPNEISDLETPTDLDEHDSRTPMYRAGSEEVDLRAKTLPPNQVIQMCLALEEAGKEAVESDHLVYQQLAKTFFAIKEENKSELTDEVLQKFALGITRRHCKRLGESLRLHDRDIDARNEEDLTVMFRTDIMLKAWVLDQRCSNYEIRCRLRRAAEQCNRHDIADLFISKDQSEVMSSDATLQACLTFTNEKQSPKANAPESNENENHDNGELMEAERTQPTDSGTGSEVSYVAAISREELERIGRYAGTNTLIAFLMEYGVGEVPEQQSTEGKELPFETKIINTLKRKLDSVHDEIVRRTFKWINTGDTPRNVLRQFLDKHDKTTPYACLLPRGREDDIFNVELVELAFRLVMADVYPFAKALGINDQLLTHYKPNFGPNNLSQGTVRIIRTDDRKEMVEILKQAGYHEEAKAIYFGFEIGLGDVVEVENSVDMAKLAQQLCVPDDIQGTSQDNQINGVERQRSVLLRWKGTVRSSTFNQRLALADALFNMGEEQLALGVISGKYRNRMINNPQSELLASTIPEEQQSELSKVLDQKKKEGQNCQDVITAWASDKTFFEIGPVQKKKKKMLSNQLLDAGFYEFAHEIMAGAWRRKDKKIEQKKEEDKGDETSKEQPHEDGNANEQGAVQDKEDKEIMEKDTEGNTHPQNTGKEGAGNVKEDKTASKTVAKNDETAENNGGESQENNDKNNDAVLATGEDNTTTRKEDVEHEEQLKKATATGDEWNIDGNVTKEDNDDMKDWDIVSVGGELQDMKEEEAVPTVMNTNETAHTINDQGGRPGESDNSGQDRHSEVPVTDDANFDHWSHSQAEAIARSSAFM